MKTTEQYLIYSYTYWMWGGKADGGHCPQTSHCPSKECSSKVVISLSTCMADIKMSNWENEKLPFWKWDLARSKEDQWEKELLERAAVQRTQKSTSVLAKNVGRKRDEVTLNSYPQAAWTVKNSQESKHIFYPRSVTAPAAELLWNTSTAPLQITADNQFLLPQLQGTKKSLTNF